MNPEFRKKGECNIELVLAMESLINVLKFLKFEYFNESIKKVFSLIIKIIPEFHIVTDLTKIFSY